MHPPREMSRSLQSSSLSYPGVTRPIMAARGRSLPGEVDVAEALKVSRAMAISRSIFAPMVG